MPVAITNIATTSNVLLWLSLLSILTALVGIAVLPQNGPMKVALDRSRIVLFVEVAGLTFAGIYAAFILGYIH